MTAFGFCLNVGTRVAGLLAAARRPAHQWLVGVGAPVPRGCLGRGCKSAAPISHRGPPRLLLERRTGTRRSPVRGAGPVLPSEAADPKRPPRFLSEGSGSRTRYTDGGLEVRRPTKSPPMPTPLRPTPGTTVRVLDEDLELAAAVDQAVFKQARLAAVAPLLVVPKGPWEPPPAPRARGRDFGLLILSGLLVRDMELAGRSFVELRGPEDLLRPWDDAADVTSVSARISWTAREPTRLAWLDGDFASSICSWPQITAALVARATRRARLLSFRLAILELGTSKSGPRQCCLPTQGAPRSRQLPFHKGSTDAGGDRRPAHACRSSAANVSSPPHPPPRRRLVDAPRIVGAATPPLPKRERPGFQRTRAATS
jgi:hypothetical protein